MFAVIYRGFVHPTMEVKYCELWPKIVRHFVDQRGAIGSALHKVGPCEYLVYLRWPSRQVRDASWGDHADKLEPSMAKLVQELKDCFDLTKPHEEIGMDVECTIMRSDIDGKDDMQHIN